MDQALRPNGRAGAAPLEFSSVMTGFDVMDRGGARIGTVATVSLDRRCILVGNGRSWLGRRKLSAVHVTAVDEIDLATCTVSLMASKEQVADAPFVHVLDQECERAVAHYYDNCLRRGRTLVDDRWPEV